MPQPRRHLAVINAPKLVGIITAMLLLSALFAIDRLTESGYIGLMGLLVGYLVGNGVAGRSGVPVDPIIGYDQDAEE